MAEYCVDCWNKLNDQNDKPIKYILTKEKEYCEGCGEFRRTIIMERRYYYARKLRFVLIPFKLIGIVLFGLWRLFSLLVYSIKDKICPRK